MRQEKPAQRDIPEEALRQSRRSRNLLAAYVLLLTAVALAVFAVACAAVDRFGWKMDLTQNQVFRLTETTETLLAELEEPVELIYCNSENDADSNIKEVLRRYAGASGQIGVSYLDLEANPAAAETWAQRNITLGEDGVMVLCGQNARFLSWSSLYALNTYTDEGGAQRYTLAGLQAETKLTSAIAAVTGQSAAGVAFTAGHSEDAPQALLDLLEGSNGGDRWSEARLFREGTPAVGRLHGRGRKPDGLPGPGGGKPAESGRLPALLGYYRGGPDRSGAHPADGQSPAYHSGVWRQHD